jgi:hypothetical protein
MSEPGNLKRFLEFQMTDGIEVKMGQMRIYPLYLVHCMNE